MPKKGGRVRVFADRETPPGTTKGEGGCSVGPAAPLHFDDSSPEEFPLFRYGICNKFFLSHKEPREVNDFFV